MINRSYQSRLCKALRISLKLISSFNIFHL